MNILKFLQRKPIRKTYKFLVRFIGTQQKRNEVGFFDNPDAVFYGKTKGEVVQCIKNTEKYIGYKILSINVE